MIRSAISRLRSLRLINRRNSLRHLKRLTLEQLENRNLMAGVWAPLAHPVPDIAGQSMMLLTDGSVMVQGGGDTASKNWYRLTPDATGSYTNGNFTAMSPMGLERLFFPSNVMPSGKVFVLGGEYVGPRTTATWTNTGEIFDPVANAWTALPNFPEPNFGDVPTALLPNGKILAGSLSSPQTYLYDPATNTWSFAATKLRSDQSDEETWTLLPDGSVLSYDIFASTFSGQGSAQRYIPSTNTWVDAGVVPVQLSGSTFGFELGPGFMLPDGRVFQVGANSNTAFYNPSTNTWAAGPVIPGGKGSDDAPGAVLPNGHVLFASDTPLFHAPTKLFDFDPVLNTITDVTPTGTLGTLLAGRPSFLERMLVLPNGDVLMSDATQQFWEFTPGGAPNDAWRPTVTSIVPNGSDTYTLTGTQLTGMSEGASYGDDAQMSTNYPIVQLTDSTGIVSYARTFNWTPGVATGNAQVTTQFQLPAGLPIGSYTLRVVASGIASAPFGFNNSRNVNVISSSPAAGSSIATAPASFVINFSSPVVPTTLQAADLLVNGLPATSVTLNAARTSATFTYSKTPVKTQGLQTMSIAFAALTGADGTSIDPFSATFRYDTLKLAVSSTTPPTGGVFTIPAASFTYDVKFNELIDPTTVGVNNLTISQGTVVAASVLAGNTTARYTITNLKTEGPLTINLPAGQVKDQFGNPDFTPFSATYIVDVGTTDYPTPLVAVAPLGSLIYDPTVSGIINFAGDADTYTINVDGGQTISLQVTPTSTGLQPTVQLIDPTGVSLGVATSAGAGQTVLLQTLPAAKDGVYRVTVGGAASTVGNFTLGLTLNAALESEGRLSGANNSTVATAQNIDTSFLTLRSPTAVASRGAVLGTTDNAAPYTVAAIPSSFTDISLTGTRSINAVGDDVTDTLTSAQLSGFTIPFMGKTYDSLSFSSNGLISFDSPNSDFINTNLANGPSQAVIAPLWTDMEIDGTGVGTASRAIFWQVVGTGNDQKLIIQWNNAHQFEEIPVFTFQAILSRDGSLQFNYGPVMGQVVVNASTVGVKAEGTSNPDRVVVDVNGTQPFGTLVGAGKSLVMKPTPPKIDFYAFTATANQATSLAAVGLGAGALSLDLIAPDGTTVLAHGVQATNLTSTISNFKALTSGTYFAKVTGDSNLNYSLVVTLDALIDTEINDDPARAQDLGISHGSLGSFGVEAGSSGVTQTFQAIDSGWWDETGAHSASNKNYLVGQLSSKQFHDYFVFDLSTVTKTIASAKLVVANPVNGYRSTDPTETLVFSDVRSPVTAVRGDGAGNIAVFNDLADGATYGSQTVNASTTSVVTTLNSAAVQDLNAKRGSAFAVGGSISTVSGIADQFEFGFSTATANKSLVVTFASSIDWYKFTVPAGTTAAKIDTSTIADGTGEFVNTLDPHIELFDTNQVLIAAGIPQGDGRNESIVASALTPGATYYVRVTAEHDSRGEYFVGVTPLRTPTITSTVDDTPTGASPDTYDGEFRIPSSTGKGWTSIVSSFAFMGDYTVHTQNLSPQSSNFAEWRIKATSPTPELFATWVALPGNATNATYQVFREIPGSTLTDDIPLLTTVVDQMRAPSDALLFGNTAAKSLGSVAVSNWMPGTMLRVRLNTLGANGNVVADGVFDPPTESIQRTVATVPVGTSFTTPLGAPAVESVAANSLENTTPKFDRHGLELISESAAEHGAVLNSVLDELQLYQSGIFMSAEATSRRKSDSVVFDEGPGYRNLTNDLAMSVLDEDFLA